MPDEDNANAQPEEPLPESIVESPAQNNHPTPHEDRTYDLQKDIRDDQRWLKYMGVATIVMSIVIAWIYYNQLTQMRLATEASTKAAQLAADALEYNAGQFNRMMRQTIHQTASQAVSATASTIAANAAKSAAGTADATLKSNQAAFRQGQRPYLWGKPRGMFAQKSKQEFWIFEETEKKEGFRMGVAVSLLNSGHSPAVNVVVTETQYKIGPREAVRQAVRAFSQSIRCPSRE